MLLWTALIGLNDRNQKEFIAVLAHEIQYCRERIQRLLEKDNPQRKFIENELPALSVEGLRKAEQCRAKERIARLARILARAAQVGARDGADSIEDMMAVAVGLGELDAVVLQQATLE